MIMITNLPKFSLTTPIVHQFANVFAHQNFELYGALLILDITGVALNTVSTT